MASTSEVGHAENVGSLNQLISACEGFGTSYNPSNTVITVPNLKIKFTDSDNAIKVWKIEDKRFGNNGICFGNEGFSFGNIDNPFGKVTL